MSERSERDGVDEGRNASAHELADRLSTAEASYLEGALDNPALDGDLAVLLLRNRGATGPLLRRLARDPDLRRSYHVRLGLVRHPRTPPGIAMDLVHHLYWRDLARAADDYRVPPPIRQTAVKLLEIRMEDLALGEQITLARTAGRGVTLALRRTRLEPVLQALLDNPTLTEDDVVAVSAHRDTPRDILGVVARSARWMRGYRVRQALALNPSTPIGVALGALSGLLRSDLQGIAGGRGRPRILRLAAQRVLSRRGVAPQPGPRPGDEDALTVDASEE